MTESFQTGPLDLGRHCLDAFTCGEQSLDIWLREYSVPATKRGTARTWVLADSDGYIMGYYALAAHKIEMASVPSRIGRGGPREIPAVLLARLAVSKDLQGEGLGASLLIDALERIVAATKIVAARVVVVDAISESVAGFYEGLGFTRVPDSLRLVQKISDIEASIEKKVIDYAEPAAEKSAPLAEQVLALTPEEARLIDCSCDTCLAELQVLVDEGAASPASAEWVNAMKGLTDQ